MSETEAAAIGRPGGYDDEPETGPDISAGEPRAEKTVPDEALSIGRPGGDDDEPIAASPNGNTVEAAPIVSLPGLPSESTPCSDKGEKGGSWIAGAAWIVFWGVLLWLGLAASEIVRTTIALPFVLRVPALVAEGAALLVAVVWIVRVAGLFIGFRKREDADLCAYYRRISRSGDFVRQYAEEDRATALDDARSLSVRSDNFTQEWESKRQAFEARRESVARGIVREHAALTAVKTAMSPWRIVDVLSVFYNNTRMVERIARLYAQPCGGPQAFRLVCGWAFNLYVAGRLGDVMGKGADTTAAKVAEALESTEGGLSWLGSVLPFAGKLFAKAGEGAANYYLCRRLGTRAIELFKPAASDATHGKRKHSAAWPIAISILLVLWFAIVGIVALARHRTTPAGGGMESAKASSTIANQMPSANHSDPKSEEK